MMMTMTMTILMISNEASFNKHQQLVPQTKRDDGHDDNDDDDDDEFGDFDDFQVSQPSPTQQQQNNNLKPNPNQYQLIKLIFQLLFSIHPKNFHND